MLRIKAPATSANLGVGYDTLCVAYDIYNIFTFTPSNHNLFFGFDDAYNNENNLVYRAYLQASSLFLKKDDIKNVTITLEEQNIPLSRGLGSSASCILAGVLAANKINNLNKSIHECAVIASKIEGHYDNIFGCAMGGFTSSFQTEDTILYDSFEVSKELHFTLLVPDTKSSTFLMRSCLPKQVSLEDTVFHLSRTIHIPKALKEGNITLLKELLKDKLHEHVRYDFIPLKDELQELAKEEDIVMTISGSGPTVLLISTKNINHLLTPFSDSFNIINPKLSNGVQLEEIL